MEPKTWLDRFRRREDGSITIFSLVMVVLILTITGAAVDIMRHEAVRAEMQGAMDRAVLAAADLDQLRPPGAVVEDYLATAGLPTETLTVASERSVNHRIVSAATRTEVDTVFLRLSGYDRLNASVRATAEERISNVEISLVLDISGSMRFNQRMDRMKPAAQNFVRKVMDEDSNGVTTLNLVPFAGQVNPGTILFDYFRGERPTLPSGPGSQAGGDTTDGGTAEDPAAAPAPDHFPAWGQAISNVVLYFDIDGDDVFDRAHKIEGFPEDAPRDVDEFLAGAVGYAMAQDRRIGGPQDFLGASVKGGRERTRYFQVKGDANGPDSDLGPTNNTGRIPGATFRYAEIDFAAHASAYPIPTGDTAEPAPQTVNMPSSCVEIGASEFGTAEMPRSSEFVPHFHYWPIDDTVMDWGWCPEEDTAVQYYSSDREHLLDFIAALRMHDGTGTHIAAKYGLALLNPENREALGHLIAAGLVDPAFAGRPIDWNDPETEKYLVIMTDGQTTDQYRPTDPTAAINGETVLQDQGGGASWNRARRSDNIDHLLQQCALARSLGVMVFTIAYETNDAAAADMRACASTPSHFFHVEGTEIFDAFDTVARQINNLRLIQ